MKIFQTLVAAIKSYDYRDKLITAFAVAVFLLMIVKMILFPYGLFNFGESDIYTEGLVSKNGIQNLNPLFVDYNEADREVSKLIFSGLMKYDPVKKAVVDDMGILTIDETKTQYTFKIRPGIKWHDGKDFTVDDAIFTYQDVIMHPSFQNEILKTNFAGVKIEKVDAQTVKFTLEKPNIFFIANFTTGILPQHILKGVDPFEILQDEFNKKPIGTGPYIVTEPAEAFQDGRTQITLTRSANYYSELPKIEFMRFLAFESMEQLVEEINSVNGVVRVSGNYIERFEDNDRFELIPYKSPQYTAVFFNLESKILKDNDKVRLALQKAVDKDVLLASSRDKVRVDTPLMELDQEEWLYQANIEQAQGALKDAGYSYAPDDKEKQGIRYNGDEEALELNLIVRNYEEGTYQYDQNKNLVDFLQNAWEDVGFSIQVEFLDEEQFKQRVIARKYDLLLVGQNLGYNLDTYSYWHSTQASPAGQNFSNYKSFQVDSLIEVIREIFDSEKRNEKLKELAEKIKTDIPAIFLFRPIYYYATDGKISGINMANVVFPSDRFFHIAKWQFER